MFISSIKRHRNTAAVFLLGMGVMISFLGFAPCAYGEEMHIYVSGNPNLYPIEYYDTETNEYQGVIPKLLKAFSSSSHYRIEYLDSNGADERLAKNKNRQAELISGCVAADDFSDEQWQSGVTVMQALKDGELYEYRILFSDIADDGLKSDLADFFAGVTEQQRSGLLLEEVQRKNSSAIRQFLIPAVPVVLFTMALSIVGVRYRKKLRAVSIHAKTDAATGIGNYDYMAHYFKQFVTDRNRVLYNMVYFYADAGRLRRIGNAKETNAFLKYMGAVLNEYTADADLLARVADGGFALLHLSASSEETKRWLQSALQRIAAYPKQCGKSVSGDVTAGIYRLKPSDHDLDEIIFNAEQSGYYAREKGLAFAVCTKDIVREIDEKSKLSGRLETAFLNGEFLVYLHFFVDASNGKICGAEALSRWAHPEKGLLSPDKYIPLMEDAHRIATHDFYILDKVCAFLAELHAKQAGNFFISCNFSRNTFGAADFAEKCVCIMQKYDFPHGELILELTENGSTSDFVYQNAVKLKAWGLRIALDDFGTGCSDIFDLEKYNFDGLKIDRDLIAQLNSETGQVILSGMIQMGHRLGMTILAEGVETMEQAEILRRLHCDVIQGFFFFQPLPLYEAYRIYRAQEAADR